MAIGKRFVGHCVHAIGCQPLLRSSPTITSIASRACQAGTDHCRVSRQACARTGRATGCTGRTGDGTSVIVIPPTASAAN